jgi:hypothetical protein
MRASFPLEAQAVIVRCLSAWPLLTETEPQPVKQMKTTIKKSEPTPIAPAAGKVAAPAPVAIKSTPLSAVPKPVAATPAVCKPAPPLRATTIEAKIDVGFGNQLFLRGQGEGLSWERGIPLECVDSQTWRLIVPAKDKLQIKLLINDSVWAKGEDVVITPGKRVELVPAF